VGRGEVTTLAQMAAVSHAQAPLGQPVAGSGANLTGGSRGGQRCGGAAACAAAVVPLAVPMAIQVRSSSSAVGSADGDPGESCERVHLPSACTCAFGLSVGVCSFCEQLDFRNAGAQRGAQI